MTLLPPGERAKNARGISPPSLLSRFTQHYLVAMATSLDKSSVLDVMLLMHNNDVNTTHCLYELTHSTADDGVSD